MVETVTFCTIIRVASSELCIVEDLIRGQQLTTIIFP